MCLGNHYNQFGGVRVSLNFGVFYEGFEEAKKDVEEEEKVLNGTLSSIEVFGQQSSFNLLRYILMKPIFAHLWYSAVLCVVQGEHQEAPG